MMPTLSKLTLGLFGNKEPEQPEPTFSDIREISEIYFSSPAFCRWTNPDDLYIELKMLSMRAQRTDEHKWDINVECWANHIVSLVECSEASGVGGAAFANEIKPFIPALEEAGYSKSDKRYPTYEKKNIETSVLFNEIRKLDLALTHDNEAVKMEPDHYAKIGQEFPGIRTCEAQSLYEEFKEKLKSPQQPAFR